MLATTLLGQGLLGGVATGPSMERVGEFPQVDAKTTRVEMAHRTAAAAMVLVAVTTPALLLWRMKRKKEKEEEVTTETCAYDDQTPGPSGLVAKVSAVPCFRIVIVQVFARGSCRS